VKTSQQPSQPWAQNLSTWKTNSKRLTENIQKMFRQVDKQTYLCSSIKNYQRVWWAWQHKVVPYMMDRKEDFEAKNAVW